MVLHRLLEGLQSNEKNGVEQSSASSSALTPESKSKPVIGMFIDHQRNVEYPLSLVGIGLDSCVLPLRHGEYVLVQSTDFFYPLVDDPYVMVIH